MSQDQDTISDQETVSRLVANVLSNTGSLSDLVFEALLNLPEEQRRTFLLSQLGVPPNTREGRNTLAENNLRNTRIAFAENKKRNVERYNIIDSDGSFDRFIYEGLGANLNSDIANQQGSDRELVTLLTSLLIGNRINPSVIAGIGLAPSESNSN